MNTVTINTGQLITLATGRFSCTMDEVYSACNSILEDDLFTHSLIRAGNFIEPRINELFPWVKSVENEYPTKDSRQSDEDYIQTVLTWIESVSDRYGHTHEVPVMSKEWNYIDPLQELTDIVSKREEK